MNIRDVKEKPKTSSIQQNNLETDVEENKKQFRKCTLPQFAKRLALEVLGAFRLRKSGLNTFSELLEELNNNI